MNFFKQARLNKFERVAGAFVGFAILTFIVVAGSIMVKKGWFESKVEFYTLLEQADGIHPGTAVQLAGIRVGAVEEVGFDSRNRILVKFYVFESSHARVTEGARIELLRPFVIGDKVMDLQVPATTTGAPLVAGTFIESDEVFSVIDIMNGRKLAPYVKTLGAVMAQVKELADYFVANPNPEARKSVAKTVKELNGLMASLSQLATEANGIARQVNRGKNLEVIIDGLATTTRELNKILPQVSADVPKLGKDFAALVSNTAVLSEEFKKVIPALAEIAPELPKTSRRAVQALDEAVVVLKAVQKSFLLRGSSQEAREEMERQPASPAPAVAPAKNTE